MSSGRYYINDSIFHLVTLETINYILNKNLDNKLKAIVYFFPVNQSMNFNELLNLKRLL